MYVVRYDILCVIHWYHRGTVQRYVDYGTVHRYVVYL